MNTPRTSPQTPTTTHTAASRVGRHARGPGATRVATPTDRRSGRLWIVRKALCAIAVAACMPYLTLKTMWLCGSRVGLSDPDFGTSTVMVAANTVTAFMEAVAVALAIAFIAPWGRRVPAWLVLTPMYIASGLLGGILLMLPIHLVTTGFSSTNATSTPIAPWIFTMVYTGFALLGITLLAGFALYAHERWMRPLRLARPLTSWPRVSSATAAASYAVAAACVALGGYFIVRFTSDAVAEGASLSFGLGALVLAWSLLSLTRRQPSRLRGDVPVVLAWAGAAQMTAWNAYIAVLHALPNDLTPRGSALEITGDVTRTFIGILGLAVLIHQLPKYPGLTRRGVPATHL